MGRRIAAAVRRHREQRGMSTQALSERCDALGWSVSRSKLANLENGERTNVTLEELHVLAAALAVPPGALLYPGAPEEPVTVLPGRSMSGLDALSWLVAADHYMPPELPRAPGDADYYGEVARGYLFARLHAERLRDVQDADPRSRRDELRELRAWREEMRSIDPDAFAFVPPLTDALAEELAALSPPTRGRSLIPPEMRRAVTEQTTPTEEAT
jgi:transcriptional regulator with XRE-family HTH domain